MINKRRVKRIRAFLYTCIIILMLLPVVLAIVCICLLFAVGNVGSTVNAVADRVEIAAASMEASVKRSSVDVIADPDQRADYLTNSGGESTPLAGTPPESAPIDILPAEPQPESAAPQSQLESVSVPGSPPNSSANEFLSPNTGR